MTSLNFRFLEVEDEPKEILLIETDNGETTEEYDDELEKFGIFSLSDGQYEFTLSKDTTRNLLIKILAFTEVDE